MGNPDGFGLKQTGIMLLGSSMLVLLGWSEPKASWPKTMRRFAAVCWPIVGLLGFYFYPEQWSLAYLVIFVSIGAIIWYPDIVPAKWRNFMLAALQRGVNSLDPGKWKRPEFLKSTGGFEPTVWDERQVSRLLLLGGPLLLFSLVSLVLFLQFPLQESLPGNSDTWLVIGLSNTYLAKAAALFTGIDPGQAMFPVDNVLAYGESSPGGASIYIFFKLIGLNDIWAYYGFITVIFALNGYGVYLLASLFVRSWLAALFAGFAFAYSNFMFAHIDDSITFFYLIPALSIFFLIRYFREDEHKYLYLAAIIGGLQPYFSVYVFVYQTAAILIVFLFHEHYSPKSDKRRYSLYLKGAFLYLLVSLPIFLYYYSSLQLLNIESSWNPWDVAVALSLKSQDPFLILPNNLIYGGAAIPEGGLWLHTRHYAFIGVVVLVLACLSLLNWDWKKALLSAIGLVAIVLAIGPIINLGDLELPALLYLPYKWSSIVSFLRVPIRAYFLFTLVVVILAATALDRLLTSYKVFQGTFAYLFTILLIGIVLLENTPMPLDAFAAGDYIYPSPEYFTFIKNNPEGLILDLPTNFTQVFVNWDKSVIDDPSKFVGKGGENSPKLEIDIPRTDFSNSGWDLFEYNREVIYLNWQTQHKQDIVGGMNGYFPTPRLIFQHWIMDLPSKGALDWLRKQGVTHFVFHKNLVLPGEEDLYSSLQDSIWLSKVFEGKDITVFQYIIPSNMVIERSIRDSIRLAENYLAEKQMSNGSWSSLSISKQPDFSAKEDFHTSIFPTLVILSVLDGSETASSIMMQSGKDYVRSKEPKGYLWNYLAQNSLVKMDGYLCEFMEGSDTTSLAWTLVGEDLSEETVLELRDQFDENRSLDGGYVNYFAGNRELIEYCPPEYDNPVSLGVNLNVLSLFAFLETDGNDLISSITQTISKPYYWENDYYYREIPYLAYLASRAVKLGAPADEILRKLIEDADKYKVMSNPAFLDNVQLASYIIAKCNYQILEGENCENLLPFVEELQSRQEQNGEFSIAPLWYAPTPTVVFDENDGQTPTGISWDDDNGYFHGSAEMTTALAISAMEIYALHSN